MIGPRRKVSPLLTTINIPLDLSPDIFIGRVRALENGLREGRGGGWENTLIARRIILIPVITRSSSCSSSSQASKVEMKSFLGVHSRIHSGWKWGVLLVERSSSAASLTSKKSLALGLTRRPINQARRDWSVVGQTVLPVDYFT